jgi:hypothetical protein
VIVLEEAVVRLELDSIVKIEDDMKEDVQGVYLPTELTIIVINNSSSSNNNK